MAKVLVVNNDIDTMSLIQHALEKRRYNVIYTGNGNAVPQIMKEFQPDVVLVDILQNEVVESLKANIETSKVPVLLMTGYTYPESSSYYSDDIIHKPFNIGLLETKIERLLI